MAGNMSLDAALRGLAGLKAKETSQMSSDSGGRGDIFFYVTQTDRYRPKY